MLQQFSLNLSSSPTPPFASGTLATMNATTGIAGEFFYNTTYSTMFSWTVDRWWPANPDPRYGFLIYDEFLGSDRVGQLDWATNAGTIAYLTNGAAINPGVVGITQLSASAIGNLRSSLGNILLGTMDIYIEALVTIPTLATVGEDFSVAIGLHDNAAYDATSQCTDGAFFSLTRSVNGANWITNTTSNGANTPKNSSITHTAGTFQRLTIVISAGSSVSFYVNGVLATVAHATNIPTGAGRQTGEQLKLDKVAGTTTGTLQVDYFAIYGFFNGARIA